MFQFLIGTVKTMDRILREAGFDPFQFLIGMVKTSMDQFFYLNPEKFQFLIGTVIITVYFLTFGSSVNVINSADDPKSRLIIMFLPSQKSHFSGFWSFRKFYFFPMYLYILND